MPVPSRKSRFSVNVHRERDGTSATKPSCLDGGGFCRGRPFYGRAAACLIQNQTEPLPPTLFHWRSQDKTIYSPEVRIIAKSLDRGLASPLRRVRTRIRGSTRYFMR